jgi:hypothetical protein
MAQYWIKHREFFTSYAMLLRKTFETVQWTRNILVTFYDQNHF